MVSQRLALELQEFFWVIARIFWVLWVFWEIEFQQALWYMDYHQD